jgi:serine/threonine-protein kinase
MVSGDGTITTIAGNGIEGYSGDAGPATSAKLDSPAAVAVDAGGNIYIADWGNNRVRIVTPDGMINTIAGNGTTGFSGDGGPAVNAALNPVGIALGSGGLVYVADQANGRVRLLTPSTPPAASTPSN